MFALLKNFFTVLILSLSTYLWSDENPYNFIDSNAQKMVIVLKENKSLFLEDRKLYEQKIKEIFEPMIDFRRVAATVMGKKYYLASSKEQRAEFVIIFIPSKKYSKERGPDWYAFENFFFGGFSISINKK